MTDLVESLRRLGDMRVPDSLYTTAADEIERLEKELAIFEDAVEHCTDPNYTKRSITSSDGWTMISSEFYFDLVMAYNDTVRKQYRKQVLLEAANIGWRDKDVAAELRRMAEG